LFLQESPAIARKDALQSIYTVSQKKHVTTFFAITGTVNIRL